MPDRDELTLEVGGKRYAGWKGVDVALSLEQISGTFEVSLSERWAIGGKAWPIRPDEPCAVRLGGDVVVTGYVDAVFPAYGPTSHDVSIWGRDKTGDLVDCSAIHKTGQWKGRTLAQIAADVARPFGIEVLTKADVGAKFPSVALEEGESAFEFLDRLAKARGVLLTSDGLGHLVLLDPGEGTATRATEALVKGSNVEGAKGELTHRDRFSVVYVKGQTPGTDEHHGAAAASLKAKAVDAGVGRYRPLIVLSDSQGGIQAFRQRAQWEIQARRARGSRATYTVKGWRMADGTLWRPNQLVWVEDDWMQVQAELLIAGVRYRKNDGGTTADLTVVAPSALERAEKRETKRKGKRSADLWP